MKNRGAGKGTSTNPILEIRTGGGSQNKQSPKAQERMHGTPTSRQTTPAGG